MLTKYGIRELLMMTVLIAAAMTAAVYMASPWWWSLIALVPLTVLWLWVLWFFRDPTRYPPQGEGLLISPCDGCVSDITPVGADSPLGEPGLRVGVFMNVFSVHVNRSPCDGRVEHVEHVPGAFLDVRNPLAYEKNESASIFMAIRLGGVEYPLVVRQVAGYVARRIVTDLRKDQPLTAAERIGMIKFGSRCEVLVPETLRPKVMVRIGDKVRAGESVLVMCEPQT
jgi:phosphatidylserine decarboxylase